MKIIIYIFSTLFIPLLSFASNDKQVEFEQTVKSVIRHYNEKDDILLNSYIDPESGIYIILKSNSEQYWVHRSQICLSKDCISKLNLPNPYGQILLEQKLDTSFLNLNLSEIADSTLVIDKKELHILTNTVRQFKQDQNTYISNEELRKIWKIESNSKRIAVSTLGETLGDRKFTFYLSYLNKNWYLSTIVLTTKLTHD